MISDYPLRMLLPPMVILGGVTVIVANHFLTGNASSVVVVVIAGLFWYVLNRTLIKPLQTLATAARAITSDVTSDSKKLASSNELDDISIALDVMAEAAPVRKQLLDTRHRFEKIIEDSLNEIFVFDAQTLHFIIVNSGARNNLGYSLVELHQLTPVDIKPAFDEGQFRAMLTPLIDGSKPVLVFETQHERKNGTTYDAEIHLQLYSDESPPVYAAIILDITARKLQHDELLLRNRAMAEVDVGVIIADASAADLPIVYANAAMERISGYSSSEILGRNPRFLQGDDRDQPGLEKVRSALQEAVPVTVLLLRRLREVLIFCRVITSNSPSRITAQV